VSISDSTCYVSSVVLFVQLAIAGTSSSYIIEHTFQNAVNRRETTGMAIFKFRTPPIATDYLCYVKSMPCYITTLFRSNVFAQRIIIFNDVSFSFLFF